MLIPFERLGTCQVSTETPYITDRDELMQYIAAE